MGASGPPFRRRAIALASYVLVALGVAGGTAGCAPRKGAAAGPAVAAGSSADATAPDPQAGAPLLPAGEEEEDLARLNDDFAALAYALHGVEPPESPGGGAPGHAHAHPHPHPHDGDGDGDEEDHEGDDVEVPSHPDWQPLGVPQKGPPARSPLADLSADEIKRRLRDDPASLGSISIGPPNRGALFNGVQMPEGERWARTDPANAYGTKESIEQLIQCIDAVHERYPTKTPKMYVGHFSARRGGRLKPHKSHQSGRDVDVSYYYTNGAGWFSLANAKNLDRPRTWAFVKALLTKADVEMILIDTSIQRMLREHALAAGEDRAFVDRVFQVSGEKLGFAPVRHARGHADHIHIRFRSPEAVASGKIAEAFLPKPAPPSRDRSAAKHAVAQKGDPRPSDRDAAKSPPARPAKEEPTFILHRARSGDTLDSLARRYGTTVAAIREANGLKGNALKEKRSYKIPVAKPSAGRPPAGKAPAAPAAPATGKRGSAKRKG